MTDRNCRTCNHSRGTQRRTVVLQGTFSSATAVQRLCRVTGLMVTIAGAEVACCSSWAPVPHTTEVTAVANGYAWKNRITIKTCEEDCK